MKTTSPSSKSPTLAIPKLSPNELKQRLHYHVPELHNLAHCEVDIVLNCDSAHVGPPEWALFAKRIQQQWGNYDGIVLLHGTDTLSYTACALSFLLRPCLKPIIITGAQRPLSAPRTDAKRNLISAVEIAAQGPRKIVNQVCVFFDDCLYQGNRVRKTSASEFKAFESPQAAPLAIVGTSIRYVEKSGKILKTPVLKPQFSPAVATLAVTPGFPAKIIRKNLLSKVHALIFVVFSSGTAPTHDPEFMELLRQAKQQQIPVIAATESYSRTPGDHATSPLSYDAALELFKQGVLWASEMTPECTFVKTALILGQFKSPPPRSRFLKLWKKELASEGCPQ